MCFTIDKNFKNSIILDEPIKVYKLCRKWVNREGNVKYTGIIRGNNYYIGRQAKACMFGSEPISDLITANMHLIRDANIMNYGIHSYSCEFVAVHSHFSYDVVLECEVPKGAEIMFNCEDGEVLSTSIIPIRELTDTISAYDINAIDHEKFEENHERIRNLFVNKQN